MNKSQAKSINKTNEADMFLIYANEAGLKKEEIKKTEKENEALGLSEIEFRAKKNGKVMYAEFIVTPRGRIVSKCFHRWFVC